MDNNNGQLILQALLCFGEPVTASEVVSHVAEISGVRPSEVKGSVEETLKGGVRYGYIQHCNRKYFSVPVELDGLQPAEEDPEEENADSEEENANSDEENAERNDHEERSRRRRRRGGRRRRRSRRRSPR